LYFDKTHIGAVEWEVCPGSCGDAVGRCCRKKVGSLGSWSQESLGWEVDGVQVVQSWNEECAGEILAPRECALRPGQARTPAVHLGRSVQSSMRLEFGMVHIGEVRFFSGLGALKGAPYLVTPESRRSSHGQQTAAARGTMGTDFDRGSKKQFCEDGEST